LSFDIVIPTLGRPSLGHLLTALGRDSSGPRPAAVVVVDDRRDARTPLPLGEPGASFRSLIRVIRGAAAGPAAARNAGWRTTSSPWVAFLDDDVVTTEHWLRDLAADLAGCAPSVVASQGRVRVPLPRTRPPTDWERNVAGLEGARWITADCAYRRTVLQEVGGFDERFPRAYREDVDLALRAMAAGGTITLGERTVVHPVRPASRWISIAAQAGNADDALMARLHGADWQARCGAPRGAFRRHVVAVATALASAALGAAWLLQTLDFAWRRIAPGPRDAREVTTMLVTSAVLPFAAVYHRVRGELRARRTARRAKAVLFDRDGTLIVDAPSRRDADDVEAMPGARAAVARLRGAGVAVGVISNQPGVGEGTLARATLDAVNAEVERLVGRFDVWRCCTHARAAACACRKPAPGLVRDAARALGVAPADCVVIGDIGSDVAAARAAGARAILVPTPVTLPLEVEGAPVVARDLERAVDLVLSGIV
jgi:histidinol-phosphate phosphatase family protein